MEHPEDDRLFHPHEASLTNLMDDLDEGEEDYTYILPDGMDEEYDMLKSGDYALVKHSGCVLDPIPELSEEGRTMYEWNMANGDTEDMAFWRVAKKLQSSGFISEYGPEMTIIKRPYDRWVKIKRHLKPIPYDDFEEIWEFVFEKERCLNDWVLELFEKQEFISKDDVLKLKGEVEDVQADFTTRERPYDEFA